MSASASTRLRSEFDVDSLDIEVWQEAKLFYIGLLVDHSQPELAETFFNSVITRMLRRTYADNDLIFVRATISTEYIESDPPIYRSYYPNDASLRECFERVVLDFGWKRPFADLGRDLDRLLRALDERPNGVWPHLERNHQIQVLGSAFYRSKAAYVFGKIVNGHRSCRSSCPCSTTAPAGSGSTRSCSTRGRSTTSSRSRARTSWSTCRCRPATSSSCAR